VAAIGAADLASGADIAVTVRSADGKSASQSRAFTIINPAPTLGSLQPESTATLSGLSEVLVHGHGFVPTSVVSFGGQQRATAFGDSTTLHATPVASDLSAGSVIVVAVSNPPPGGGTSGALNLTVLNPAPLPIGLSPAAASAGGGTFTLTVSGSKFAIGAVVTWNGLDRTTSVVGSGTLTADIGAGDIAASGLNAVRVRNPGPGGGTSSPLLFTVGTPSRTDSATPIATLSLTTSYLVSDAGSGIIYAAATDSIVAINGSTGAVAFAIPVSGQARRLAISDDGAYLYAAFDRPPVIRRIRLATRAVDLAFGIGTDSLFGDTLQASDVRVVPAAPRSVVVARMSSMSPGASGVAVYDDGVLRGSIALPAYHVELASDKLAATENPAVYYGFDSKTTEAAVRQYTVSLGGVIAGGKWQGLTSGAFFVTEIFYAFGRLFATDGSVILAESMTREGALATSGWVCVDPPAGRVYVLSPAGGIAAYNPITRAAIGSVPTESGANHLVRWGADGFAYRTNYTVVVFRSTMVN
jgi:hypothetical protein